MKKLLCVVSALVVALPLYAQSGAGTSAPADSSTMGSGSATDSSVPSGSSDVQMEEKTMDSSSTTTSPSGSDVEKEETYKTEESKTKSKAPDSGSSTTPSSGSETMNQ